MGMNLCFFTKIGNHFIDFPFQTPTELTYAVLENRGNLENQLSLIKETLESWDSLELYEEVERMMKDDTLNLEMI